jgi:hypothetical protein
MISHNKSNKISWQRRIQQNRSEYIIFRQGLVVREDLDIARRGTRSTTAEPMIEFGILNHVVVIFATSSWEQRFKGQLSPSRLQTQGVCGLSVSFMQHCHHECYYETLNGLNAMGNAGCTEWRTDELTHYICSLQDGRVQVYRRVVQEETIGCPPLSPSCSVSSPLFGANFFTLHLYDAGAGNTAN